MNNYRTIRFPKDSLIYEEGNYPLDVFYIITKGKVISYSNHSKNYNREYNIGFIIGLLGLPNPFLNLSITLALALCTLGAMHFTSIRFKKWSYFKRYVEPLPFFLPINLVSMWAPAFSLAFRLFGNALAGYCILTITYLAFSIPDSMSFGFVITPVLHAYFDIFDGLIQMAVFTMLTMVNVAQEAPSKEEERAIEQLA